MRVESGAVHRDERVTVRAPGKVNIVLGVGDLDEHGYHELATVFQALALFEDVTATHAGAFTLEVHGRDAAGVPEDDRNLALRAARMLAARTGYTGGVHLRIDKRVPVAGGMGGGSADAAAALVACNELWQTGASAQDLHELASQLGADVPFLLLGGTAVGHGRGDVLTPVLTGGAFHWVLVTSDDGLSTPVVYGTLDELRAARRGDLPTLPVVPRIDDDLLLALRSGSAERLAGAIRNDLQEAAVHLRPQLQDTIDAGVAAGALAGIVSGSGPTVALLCASEDAADAVAAELRAQGRTVIAASGPAPGASMLG